MVEASFLLREKDDVVIIRPEASGGHEVAPVFLRKGQSFGGLSYDILKEKKGGLLDIDQKERRARLVAPPKAQALEKK